MTTLATCSFRAFEPGAGTPVVTSLTVPKWLPEAKGWPVAHVLTPRWSYFRAEPDEFAAQYLAQLDRFGAEKIARCLHSIAREHGAERLILLCHESPETAEWACHRRLFAAYWLSVVGERVEEVTK